MVRAVTCEDMGSISPVSKYCSLKVREEIQNLPAKKLLGDRHSARKNHLKCANRAILDSASLDIEVTLLSF